MNTMTDTIESLQSLETILRKKAACALAQSDVHKLAGEQHEMVRELRRHETGKFYADVCRDAAKKLSLSEEGQLL